MFVAAAPPQTGALMREKLGSEVMGVVEHMERNALEHRDGGFGVDPTTWFTAMSRQLELLGDVTWWQWSKINQLPLVRTSGPASGATLDTLVLNFRDTWRLSAGANYKLSGPLTLKAGVAYDQSPVRSADQRTVRLPDNDRYWLSVGLKYAVSKNGVLDAGYSYVKIKDADINSNQAALNRGIVNGSYEAKVHVLGVQYQHTF
jgi:long-chain fatty acid transport protein